MNQQLLELGAGAAPLYHPPRAAEAEAECSLGVTDLVRNRLEFIQHTKNLQNGNWRRWGVKEENQITQRHSTSNLEDMFSTDLN